ncbi:hypothetical protein HFV02_12180 [Acidithiobacillus caldus]|uniref:hypothetical protein n=1 Tax=Acidithiobacillus caldus TaxID=33059 RepID=UPI001C067CA1|nr:hypothetical protein [Acidithiobacillus caldus]MBU2802989.1 hypothetical protein [Acidithiobacillus caldus]
MKTTSAKRMQAKRERDLEYIRGTSDPDLSVLSDSGLLDCFLTEWRQAKRTGRVLIAKDLLQEIERRLELLAPSQ